MRRLLDFTLARRKLLVGVDDWQWRHDPSTGHGRVWNNVLNSLNSHVVFSIRTGDSTAPRGSRVDVWLADGHWGDPEVDGPVVAFVHEVGWGSPELDEHHAPGFADRMEVATKSAVGRATQVITASRSAKDQIIRAYGIAADRVHVVPHGVDRSTFHPRSGATGTPVDRLVRSQTPYVLFAASLHPRKNIAAVREAVSDMAARGYPHALVVVAGPSPDRTDSSVLERAALAELPGAPGRLIRVLQPSDMELAQVMSGAAVFCQPSLAEGFGLTPLEAMACGAPVIVSNRGSLPEVVDGAGLIVEPTGEAVRDAIIRVIEEPGLADHLRNRGRKRASQLTWARAAGGWLRVLQRAAQTGDDRSRGPSVESSAGG